MPGQQPHTLDELPEWLTTEEASQVLRTDEDYVRRQCKSGAIKATNLKGSAGYRIHRDSLRSFLGVDPPPARPRPPRQRKRAR
jgi:excisionase family DNA binding protein